MAIELSEDVLQLKASHHVRFSELPWYDPEFGPSWMTVGGAGGIGSWLCAVLSRAGYVLHVWDFDTIDETNFGGQLYSKNFEGKNKAESVKAMCEMLGAEQMIMTGQTLTETADVSPICFSAFDNMKARKILFESWVKTVNGLPEEEKRKAIFVDGRMLAEAGHIYWVTIDKIEAYRTQLFEDSVVGDQPCSAKATSHCGAFISSIMMAGFTNWVTNVKLEMDAREVPFKMEFELALLNFTFKTEKECTTLNS
jgi:molybdopterin/thiamine biosynthesis adenylyltransferase